MKNKTISRAKKNPSTKKTSRKLEIIDAFEDIPSSENKVYYPPTNPDRTWEFEKLAREANTRRQQQAEEDKRHREYLKQLRITADKQAGRDKYTHAIDIIIEWAEMVKDPDHPIDYGGDRTSFTVDYYHFNFEERWDVAKNLFEPFLNRLKRAGCMSEWHSHAAVGRAAYGFTNVNVMKLKEYKKSVITDSKKAFDHNTNRHLKFPDILKWYINEEHHKGVYEISPEIRIEFHGSRFGGINELIKNSGHEVTRDQLRSAIQKHTQGEKKGIKEINLSEWKYELERERKDFTKYFYIEYIPPHYYRILLKQ